MVAFPGCKVNIGLNIIAKRADGFHSLESVFFPISLSDILEIVPSERFECTLTGLPVNGKLADNLVVKAYELLKKKFDLPPVHIHLHKVVPMGAGLGGGSADAAQTLVLLNSIFDLKISTADLEKMADTLGSDCAFFIKNQAAQVTGKGEHISHLNIQLAGFHILIVNPGIHISTKEAFTGINCQPNGKALFKHIKSPVANWEKTIKNDFEATIFPKHTEIETIKNKLYAEGAVYASMTGTGSSVYGIFKTKPASFFNDYFEWTGQL